MKKYLLTTISALFLGLIAQAQITISGMVKDEQGAPVIGATAQIKGANYFGVSDLDGRFSVENIRSAAPYILEVRSVGYEPQLIELAEAPTQPLNIVLVSDNAFEEVIVTARRRKEPLRETPIPISVVGGAQIENGGAFNVNRIKELVPTVQLYSSNPRNTTLNIRGLGSTFGLTNDGIDPGVGFYVDGVYFARPAATTLDFIDIEQVEVLRGPQGTLFGKNTTAGAFNITTRKPGFTPVGKVEVSYGNYGFIQSKASVSGPLSKKLAGRLSFSGTQRDGNIYNVAKDEWVNDMNNLGARAQLLYVPSAKVDILLSGDFTQQRPNGYAQVVAGVAPTQRAAFRQFEQIIADLDYDLPSRDPFDRLIDHDTPWRSKNDYGGASANIDVKLGSGVLTATSAYRYWAWGPSNDRDFTGLQALSLSQAPSIHHQLSQEIRYAGQFSSRLSGVFGLFALREKLDPDGAHTEESGRHQWRFSQNNTNPLWQTPGLLEGYGRRNYPRLRTFSSAFFGQIDWAVTSRFHILPGIRVNYDVKDVDFSSEVYGGLQTQDPALIALQRQIYSPQSFKANIEDTNVSGQFTLKYVASDKISTFATLATNFKPVGLNLGGLPTAGGEVLIDLAVIKPEEVTHYEIGIKTTPTASSAINLTVYNTDIKNYQTLVQVPDLSLNRGYLANAGQVRVRGVEVDANARFTEFFSANVAVAYTDGKYVEFTNAPPPLEEVGGPTFKDISGGELPGISQWTISAGGELSAPGKLFGQKGRYFLGLDAYYRSDFSSNPTPSQYLVVEGYALLNGRLGFQDFDGLSVFLWARNLLDQNYFEQLLAAAGSAGHYAAVLGDPQTFGITLRYAFQGQ